MPGLSTGYVLPVLLSCVSSLCALLSKIWGGGWERGREKEKKDTYIYIETEQLFRHLESLRFFFFLGTFVACRTVERLYDVYTI